MPLILVIILIIQFCYIYNGLLISQKIFTHDSIIWSGSFCYYIDCLVEGYFPFWDPYILAGSPFYPNIHGHGLLDPLIALPVFLVKVFKLSSLTAWIYFCLSRLLVFTIGSYYLFKRITNSPSSAVLTAGILLFAVTPIAFRQMGILEYSFLTPFALLFLLLFFDNIQNKKKYLYAIWLVVIIGISMNIFIPAFFVFNLFTFTIILLILKRAQMGIFLRSFFEKRFLAFLSLSLLLIAMMAAPSFSLYKEDEMFPSVRIIQKNNEYFKKMIASEISTSSISNKFTNELGVYSSYGNVVNLIYPDLWKSFFEKNDFFAHNDLISETLQYIGIIPFIFCIIGFLYSKSYYRFLALIMLILISINMLSFYGVHSRPPNNIQIIFNMLFPFLKSMEVREVLSTFFLLYLCILLSIGLKLFFNRIGFLVLTKKKHKQIIIISISILLLKIGISLYCFKAVYRSYVDLLSLVSLVFFPIFIYAYSKERVKYIIFYSLLLLLIFIDIFYYDYSLEKLVLKQNWLDPILANKRKDIGSDFEYFRSPFIDVHTNPICEPIAFAESLLKTKGALSKGNNHHFLTTKRYYDYLTHASLQNQFVLSGVVYPIIRFFPADNIKLMPEIDLLKYLEKDNKEELGNYLYLSRKRYDKTGDNGYIQFSNFEQYEDVSWLKADYIRQFYSDYLNREGDHLKELRENINRYLETPVYQFEIKHFSPNRLYIRIKNEKEGYLYYSDGWSKHWKAFDGDREIPVEVANYNFKAIHLKEGDHTVRFIFDPKYYRYGLISYCTGLIISMCLVVLMYLKFGKNKGILPN